MGIYRDYNFNPRGGGKIIINYEGAITLSNPFVEQEVEAWLDDLIHQHDDAGVDRTRLLALILGEFGDEIEETALDLSAEEMAEEYVKEIEIDHPRATR